MPVAKSTSIEMPDDLVTVAELTRILPVSSTFLRRQADAGGLPHWRVGSVRMFSLREVLATIRQDGPTNKPARKTKKTVEPTLNIA